LRCGRHDPSSAGQRVPDLCHRDVLVVDPARDLFPLASGARQAGQSPSCIGAGPTTLAMTSRRDALLDPARSGPGPSTARMERRARRAVLPIHGCTRPTLAGPSPAPKPEDLLHLQHAHLHEGHGASPIRAPMAASAPAGRTGARGHQVGSPVAGRSHGWRKGGPMLLAELSSGRSRGGLGHRLLPD